MNIFTYITILYITVIVKALANQDNGGGTTSSQSALPTYVFVTRTVGGTLVVQSSLYTQSLMLSFASTTGGVQSGGIGLGTISGSVGDIKSYEEVTITSTGNAPAPSVNVYGGIVGIVGLILGFII